MPSGLTWRAHVDETRTRLWPLPVAALVCALILGVALPVLDSATDDDLPTSVSRYLFGGNAGSAQTLLSAIATSLITVTSLTFSLTVLTLQLASSQYSPRLLRTFTRDRFVQRTLALFLGSFVYALTVLRTVRTTDGGSDAFVPQISVTVAYMLTLASALGLVLFLAHLAREIRVETVLRTVHDEADDSVSRVLGDRRTLPDALLPAPSPGSAVRSLRARESGFVVSVSAGALVEAAVEVDAVVTLDRRVGDAVVAGTPVARAWSAHVSPLSPEDAHTLQERLAEAVSAGYERTSEHDVAFGLRQLTDVALKALSPGINDPTTAVHALSHAAALLCDLVPRDLDAEVVCDDAGCVRVVVRQWSFSELLALATVQPLLYGASDVFVLTAVWELLEAVAQVDRAGRHSSAVGQQLSLLDETLERGDLGDSHRAHLAALASSTRHTLGAPPT